MAGMIPLVDVKAQWEEVKEEVLSGWNEVLETCNLFLGPNVRAFEQEFASFCGVKFAKGIASGTDALTLALKAVGVEGKEVILPSLTFFATAEAVVMAGGIPVFAEIEEKNYCISPEDVERKITDKTRAVIVVHLYGHPAPVEKIKEIIGEREIYIIEDSAQAHGSRRDGKITGGMGNIAAFSFYISKNLSALGEAGCITTNSRELADRIELLRNHGQVSKYEHILIGTNSRLDELQAVVLRAKLKRLEEWNEKRQRIAQFYLQELKDLPVILPEIESGCTHTWHLFVVRTERRDGLFDYLRKKGIGCGIHYKVPCHLQPPMREYGYKEGMLPLTERITQEVLSLPIYPHLEEEDAGRVVEEIRRFFNG